MEAVPSDRVDHRFFFSSLLLLLIEDVLQFAIGKGFVVVVV